MQQATVGISGTSAMLMHNGRMANPLDPYVRALKEYTGKTRKTDADHEQIAKLEFLGGLYYDDKAGVYIPGQNIDATVRNGAQTQRKGTAIKRGMFTLEEKIPLVYEGPRKPEELYAAGFSDVRGVSSQGSKGGSRVMRCRPVFAPPWSCQFTLMFDPEVISGDDLRLCVELGGRLIGLNDGRPRYGKYQIDMWEVA